MDYNTEIVLEKKKETTIKSPVIEIADLYKSFGDNHVLNGFNLSIKKGETVAVVGKSGSGKSVLIKCVVGLIKPDSGKLNVFGQDVASLSYRDLDKLRARIGFLFQSNALYDSMTVKENLLFPMRRLRVQKTEEEIEELIKQALESVELPGTENLMPAELSGGMRKRIALARTLILRPEIILYDEPTTGLDPITGKGIGNLMNSIHDKYNSASLIISHDMSCIKLTAHRVVLLINGINYAEGSYEDLERSNDIQVKAFFE